MRKRLTIEKGRVIKRGLENDKGDANSGFFNTFIIQFWLAIKEKQIESSPTILSFSKHPVAYIPPIIALSNT